ncbi:hypothetical protein F1880_005741 [Penicillium rolfsii]|nr:hypothetical protein F1880_005741 [Penicillium rolfsii]
MVAWVLIFAPRMASYLDRCSGKMLIGQSLSRGNAENERMGIVGPDAAVVCVGYRWLEMGQSPCQLVAPVVPEAWLFVRCFLPGAFGVSGMAVDARSKHDRQHWAVPWPQGQMVRRGRTAARDNLIEAMPSRSDEQAGWDRPALTDSRDDLRGVGL